MSAQNLVEPLVLAVARTTVAPWCRTRQRSRLAARVRVVTVASPRAPAPCGRGRKRRQGAARQQDGRRGGDRCRHAHRSLLDNPAKAGMLRSSRFTAPAAPSYSSCGVRKPLEADLAGEGALREEQAVPVEFCPGG
jgi:hypothetical protein